MAWAAQMAWLCSTVDRLRGAPGSAWSDQGMVVGLHFLEARVLVRDPMLTFGPVAWRADAVELRSAVLSRSIGAHPNNARLQLPGAAARLTGGPWRWDGDATLLQTDRLTALLGTTTVQADGVAVRAGVEGLRVTARHVSTPGGTDLAAMDTVVAEVMPSAPASPVRLHGLEAGWHGARLSGSGALEELQAGMAFEGAVAVSDYGTALDKLVRQGALPANAALAMRAVLDVHAAAKPPAPLTVAWRDGTLVVAGFPLWRAAPD